jgi:ssDNA-binding Zn-finger/Zn-ribbon topoisomerase 1
MEFEGKTIVCKLCGANFIWLAGEQEFYHDKGLSQPAKCPECRAELRRKLHRQGNDQWEEVRHG